MKMVHFDFMTIFNQILTTLTVAAFGGLFTYLWKMNSRMQRSEDRIVNLCDQLSKSVEDKEKLLEHDTEIKLSKVEITNIKQSVHDLREDIDKHFDELRHNLDRLSNKRTGEQNRDTTEEIIEKDKSAVRYSKL